ncbi:MAG: hypothetical protein HQ559_08550 [Lentisphaerae bacterium]|nr:hypothetical protein [Lentisphaerota bacterium]
MAETGEQKWRAKLAGRLEELRPVLAKQGYVQREEDSKRGVRFRLRYATVDEGGVRHWRTLYIGNSERAEWVRQWLTRIRQTKLRLLQMGRISGYSGKALRRLAGYAGKLASDFNERALFLAGGFPGLREPEIRWGKRRGRPSRRRLW